MARGAGLAHDPVPLEYSIEWLTCAFASRLHLGRVTANRADEWTGQQARNRLLVTRVLPRFGRGRLKPDASHAVTEDLASSAGRKCRFASAKPARRICRVPPSTTTSVTQWTSNGQARGDAHGTNQVPRPLRSTAGDHTGSCRTRTLPLDATARRLGHRLRSRVSSSEVTRWRSSMVLGTCRTMSMSGCSAGRNWNISRSNRPISG